MWYTGVVSIERDPERELPGGWTESQLPRQGDVKPGEAMISNQKGKPNITFYLEGGKKKRLKSLPIHKTNSFQMDADGNFKGINGVLKRKQHL